MLQEQLLRLGCLFSVFCVLVEAFIVLVVLNLLEAVVAAIRGTNFIYFIDNRLLLLLFMNRLICQ